MAAVTGRRTRLTPSEVEGARARADAPAGVRRRGPMGERPSWWSSTPGVGVPWHRATAAQLASLYPWQVDQSFGVRGPWMGVNVTGGLADFHYEPFELYPHVLTSPSVIVFGDLGTGKSTTVKSFLWRAAACYGDDRFIAIVDPKGEYGALAGALGLPVLRLHPGGGDRLNPMDPLPGEDRANATSRQGLAAAMCANVVGRRLDGVEDAVLGWTIGSLARGRPSFTLVDVARALHDPPPELVALSHRSPLELTQAATPLLFALDKLCSRTLHGMFDAATTLPDGWADGPGLVIDVSAVFHDREAFPLVMLAASSWLSAVLCRPWRRRSYQVFDEVWAAVRVSAEHVQASLKLARTWGVSTWLLCHRPSDLVAQSDDGTSAAKIAAGLLADTQPRVLHRLPVDQVPLAAELLDLTEREREYLPQLVRGRALWRLQRRSAIVQQILTPTEMALTDTDSSMSDSG